MFHAFGYSSYFTHLCFRVTDERKSDGHGGEFVLETDRVECGVFLPPNVNGDSDIDSFSLSVAFTCEIPLDS